jgi:hypothetical protein
VSNGTKLFSAFDKLDGRRQTARRFRDLIEITQNDLGGPELLSEGQRQLIRRAATLSICAETMEADLVRDIPFPLEAYGPICDRLRRIYETIGLERRARPVNDEFDDAMARVAARRVPSDG